MKLNFKKNSAWKIALCFLENNCFRNKLGVTVLVVDIVCGATFITAQHLIGNHLIHQASTEGAERSQIFVQGSLVFSLLSKSTMRIAVAKAITSRSNALARDLLDAGATLEPQGKGDIPLLANAASVGNIEMSKDLLARGADVNEQGTKFMYPLAFAVLNNQVEMAKFLISKDADVNRVTKYYESPLALAQKYKLEEMQRLLVSHGAR